MSAAAYLSWFSLGNMHQAGRSYPVSVNEFSLLCARSPVSEQFVGVVSWVKLLRGEKEHRKKPHPVV